MFLESASDVKRGRREDEVRLVHPWNLAHGVVRIPCDGNRVSVHSAGEVLKLKLLSGTRRCEEHGESEVRPKESTVAGARGGDV